jgi:hypothetical protein
MSEYTRCLDRFCPQKLTCARWVQREDPGAPLHIDTLRTPGECRCRPCKAWLPATMNAPVAPG